MDPIHVWIASMSQCLSRVTERHTILYFADQKHKFFLEHRCDRLCVDQADKICPSCSTKTDSTIQFCRRFNHGLIYDPIPERSHLFESNWYEDGVRRYGAPSDADLQIAREHQQKARYKVEAPCSSMEKRVRKPRVAKTLHVPDAHVIVPDAHVIVPDAPVIVPDAPKKAVKRKPKAITPVKMADPSMVQKEVVLPTHMEQVRDEIDTDGYEIEYVKLSVFTLGDVTYFRDPKKNKLYKRIKEKMIGAYVGRYDGETIHTDVPDSDEE